MIRLLVILLIPFIVMTACVDTEQSVTQPESGYSSGWRDGGSAEEICHEYMELLGDAQTMHYGKYNEYTDNIEDLQEFLQIPVESIYCPVNGEYLFSGDISNEYYIECPSGAEMSHGHIWIGYTSWPPDPSEHTEICHERMINLASACSMYYGKYNCYPDGIEDLQEFFTIPVDSIQCPVNGEYIIEGDEEDCYIACPSNVIPSHGYILNGVVSWPPDPSDYLEYCRSNMRSLATACAMYYGSNNRYPEELSDLEEFMENWDLECPACDTMYLYETNPEGDWYSITCPLPGNHNHGSIVDGSASWE
ncbi:MAG: hypothetical protein K8R76_00105 [Candidatus Aegiribacteria sp.]|nr:hypothetical protein [Candidatus Aegiribacteria sp.]